ncbi:bifunctional 4-hydroxy-2-oxoglutarate aldolase/2-dehydro-3-deoxy-phosphogluconate aldolase [Schumannella luteola]
MPSARETLSGSIVPVVVLDDAALAPDLVAALAQGGIDTVELTLRTPAGLEAIRSVADSSSFIGAGTVLTVRQVEEIADAGAAFVVSPGFDEEVVQRALELGLTVLPGIATPTELQRALKAGLEDVKLFPADRLGGLDMIKALAGPFPNVGFMPSGGVSTANARDYLAHPAVFAISGSWMVQRDLLARGDFDEIARLSAEAVALVSGAGE